MAVAPTWPQEGQTIRVNMAVTALAVCLRKWKGKSRTACPAFFEDLNAARASRETRTVDNAQHQPQMLCDPRSLASLHFLDHAGAA